MTSEFDYVISCRNLVGQEFGTDPGPVKYLRVPANARKALPAHVAKGEGDLNAWAKEVVALADGDANPMSISPKGDVLVFIHGYNNTPEAILWRQRRIASDLREAGWRGVVVGFDWPCDTQTLNYIGDRWDAATIATRLVEKCVELIVKGREDYNCDTNVHVLAHSTGAYIVMEAFAQADKKGRYFESDWQLGQVAFIGGDVSASSLGVADAWSRPMFERICRLTNYVSPYDAALAVSNAKRLGTAARAGRVGAAQPAHPKSVDVHCGEYFATLDPMKVTFSEGANFTHSWHIGDKVFALDLAMTLEGAIDRGAIPTRREERGKLNLFPSKRPKFSKDWDIKRTLGPLETP